MSMDYFDGDDFDWDQEGVPTEPTPSGTTFDQVFRDIWEPYLTERFNTVTPGPAWAYYTTAPASHGTPATATDATTSGTYAGITRSTTPMWTSSVPTPRNDDWVRRSFVYPMHSVRLDSIGIHDSILVETE